jgi:hypothetical protein
MSTTISIDRTGLSLLALVINGSKAAALAGAGYWLPEAENGTAGLAVPSFQPRRIYAPDSQWVPGRRLLGSVLDQGALTIAVHVEAPDVSTLAARKSALETALWQFSYTVTVVVDGLTLGAYNAEPALLQWAAPSSWDRADNRARAVLQIPVNP